MSELIKCPVCGAEVYDCDLIECPEHGVEYCDACGECWICAEERSDENDEEGKS